MLTLINLCGQIISLIINLFLQKKHLVKEISDIEKKLCESLVRD